MRPMWCVGTLPYPGVERALDELAAAGVSLALCTNKVEGLTHQLLAALGWKGRFAAVVGGDSLPTRKPDPAMLHEAIARAGGGPAAYVGDSLTDADTARAAGVPFVAVSFGFSDLPVEALGADAMIDAYDDLPRALAQLAARNALSSR
jgi:phosphoglycolate phosphatase